MALSAATSFKKKDGLLVFRKDGTALTWTLAGADAPTVSIPTPSISNLQQMPPTAPKVALRIYVTGPDSAEPQVYTFTFTSSNNAREQATAIKDGLQKMLQQLKSAPPDKPVERPANGASAAMAIAQATNSNAPAAEEAPEWYTDEKLLKDDALQQSLLKSDVVLRETLAEALQTKPETLMISKFMTQFWMARTNLLRAHAIQRSQQRGAYNVLSTIKPKTVNDTVQLSLGKDEITLIFDQHPLVKRVYDETVPKLDEREFWSRFFTSRLFKKLKGERIVETDSTDVVLDKYLKFDGNQGPDDRQMASHIPHVIDLEGNETNHSQKKGNQPDITMRYEINDRVPIIRTLNSLSERIMAHVAPVDGAEQGDNDEETMQDLALKDLAANEEDNRILLNVRSQRQFFTVDKEHVEGKDQVDPIKALKAARRDLAQEMDLKTAIGIRDDSSDDEDEEQANEFGSKVALSQAMQQIVDAIQLKRRQPEESFSSDHDSRKLATNLGLSKAVYERLVLTNSTTNEFLRQFWQAFLSGNPDRATDIAKCVESLQRSETRAVAIAKLAEQERAAAIEARKAEIREIYQRTGTKQRFSSDQVRGGAKVVKGAFQSTFTAVHYAIAEYQKALAQEGLEANFEPVSWEFVL